MIIALAEAVSSTCGGKAGALGALLRAGLPVPDGFVVPFATYLTAAHDLDLGAPYDLGLGGPYALDAVRQALKAHPLDTAELRHALAGLGDPPVAVRSSAANEDTGQSSAAGQHESFLAVRGAVEVADAVRACWASLFTSRAVGYRGHHDLAMAVIVQRHLDAEVSGVMFTPSSPDGPTEIEASWGLGPSVVEGKVTPDSYRVTGDGTIHRTIADKHTRLDRHGDRLVLGDVPASARQHPTIDDATATRLAELGEEIAALRGGPQDIEWAIADGRLWVLQARPITAALPQRTEPSRQSGAPVGTLIGTPGSQGTATGTARIVRGPGDFSRVRPGDILICPFTDPAWTLLLRIAAGVVTETGGMLSHAAIVAREHGIPAVLGTPAATTKLRDGTTITINGSTGTITYP
ncbi:PEP/pyruvate-binding domain-containing protein [Nonomuraea sp. NPDC003754]